MEKSLVVSDGSYAYLRIGTSLGGNMVGATLGQEDKQGIVILNEHSSPKAGSKQ